VYQPLVSPHLTHYDIVFLLEVITLTEYSPDERGQQHHQ
jgi:hypothetical protein